jgi:RecA-family ATPase
MTCGTDRRICWTKAFSRLRAECERLQPVLVILDNIAQIYAGPPNEAHPVTAFVNRMTAIAQDLNCAVLLLGHTAKTEGSEFAGSMAWENAVRSRLFLESDAEGSRKLTKPKANYSANDAIELEYQGGVFVRVDAETNTEAHRERVDEMADVLLDAVRAYTSRQEAASNVPTARNYLVRKMIDDGQLVKASEKLAREALVSLIDAGRLLPNTTLPWKNSSRHAVQGLAVAE